MSSMSVKLSDYLYKLKGYDKKMKKTLQDENRALNEKIIELQRKMYAQ
jgi:hypothetical protein